MEKSAEILLSGHEDFDMHYTTANQVRLLPDYYLDSETRVLQIHDPAWGECEIGKEQGDEVLIDLFTNPLVQRMASIEQLTLPKKFATMPGSFDFSRFEHLWGSVVFVRKMIERARAEGQEITPEESIRLQLRTFVSDLGHTAYSHLGDWLFQGFGGSEDQHDIELRELLDFGGVNEILVKHGYSVDEIAFPEIEDWVGRPGPDLCVDRVDYGVREMLRWVSGFESSAVWLNRFTIVDDQLVMSSKQDAKQFAIEFGLLATEHWGQPTHRLQLQLFGELVRGVITDEGSAVAMDLDISHPRDILYTIDRVLDGASRAVGTLNHDLHEILLSTARAQRKIFAHGRSAEIDRFLSNIKHRYNSETDINYPGPMQSLGYHTEYTGLKPYNIEIIPVESPNDVGNYDKQPHTLDSFLPALKPRVVDPLYIDSDGSVKRLSETDEEAKRLLGECREIQKQAYVARYHADPQFLDKLKEKMGKTNEEWERMLTRERASKESMANLFRDVGMYAVGSGSIRIRHY